MKNSGNDCVVVRGKLGQYFGDFNGVTYEGLSRVSHLFLMMEARELIGVEDPLFVSPLEAILKNAFEVTQENLGIDFSSGHYLTFYLFILA
jgi:hypothetical protein